MKAVCETIGVARSKVVERSKGRGSCRIGRPPEPDGELVAEIEEVIGTLPTYGYRRVHAVLRRKARASGTPAPNHKRVYRVMKLHGLLLDRHAGGHEQRPHEVRVGSTTRQNLQTMAIRELWIEHCFSCLTQGIQ